MARAPQIEDPKKVTLYLPKDTIKRGKEFAQGLGTSLSKLVTETLEDKMSGTTRHTIDIPDDVQAGLEKLAAEKKTTVSGIIASIVTRNV